MTVFDELRATLIKHKENIPVIVAAELLAIIDGAETKGDLIERSTVIDVLKETGIIQDNDLGHLIVEEIERIPIACDMERDCCEWKPTKRNSNLIASPHMELYQLSKEDLKDILYCPYCGKPIKILEVE